VAFAVWHTTKTRLSATVKIARFIGFPSNRFGQACPSLSVLSPREAEVGKSASFGAGVSKAINALLSRGGLLSPDNRLDFRHSHPFPVVEVRAGRRNAVAVQLFQ
jgi:hypothetical protein